MQSHECEPEAGKGVGGSCLAERMSHYDLGSRCGAAFALRVTEVQDCVETGKLCGRYVVWNMRALSCVFVGWTESVSEWSAESGKAVAHQAGARGREEARVHAGCCTEGRSRRRSSWLHRVQGHECEPEAGKVSGHGLSR